MLCDYLRDKLGVVEGAILKQEKKCNPPQWNNIHFVEMEIAINICLSVLFWEVFFLCDVSSVTNYPPTLTLPR